MFLYSLNPIVLIMIQFHIKNNHIVPVNVYTFILFLKLIYLFIFGCVGSSLLHADFL